MYTCINNPRTTSPLQNRPRCHVRDLLFDDKIHAKLQWVNNNTHGKSCAHMHAHIHTHTHTHTHNVPPSTPPHTYFNASMMLGLEGVVSGERGAIVTSAQSTTCSWTTSDTRSVSRSMSGREGRSSGHSTIPSSTFTWQREAYEGDSTAVTHIALVSLHTYFFLMHTALLLLPSLLLQLR